MGSIRTDDPHFREGVRASITWLHSRAKEMNDPRARDILNVAANDLGIDLIRAARLGQEET